MIDFAMKISQAAYLVDETDFEALKAFGFEEEDIWDIMAITGPFRFFQPDGECRCHASE